MMHKFFEHNLEKLNTFYDAHGHCFILRSDKDYAKTRQWLHEMYAMNKLGKLDKDLFFALDEINVDWKAFGKQWESWEDHYRKLSKYKDKYGTANVSQLVKGIGPWLSAQRVSYRQNRLSESKIFLLELLGISWNPIQNNEARWDEQFSKILAFKIKNGHCNVPRRELPDPGIWVSAQRTAFRIGRLSEDRIKKLESIGFEWSAK